MNAIGGNGYSTFGFSADETIKAAIEGTGYGGAGGSSHCYADGAVSFGWPAGDPLPAMVRNFRYKDGWQFTLDDIGNWLFSDPVFAGGNMRSLTIRVTTTNSLDGKPASIRHSFPAPDDYQCYTEARLRRWLFDRVMDIERHEAMEFFKILGSTAKNEKPFFPDHGTSPYAVRDRTSADGASAG